jgi:hypothetical protein
MTTSCYREVLKGGAASIVEFVALSVCRCKTVTTRSTAKVTVFECSKVPGFYLYQAVHKFRSSFQG